MQPFPLIPLSFALLLSLEMWLTRKQNIKSVCQFPIYFVINYYHYNYYIVFSYKINFTWHEQYSWYHDKHLNFKEHSFFNARIGEISLKLSGKKKMYISTNIIFIEALKASLRLKKNHPTCFWAWFNYFYTPQCPLNSRDV